jgi:chromate reductase, NAD(P)H dehydrogenase (quinone)
MSIIPKKKILAISGSTRTHSSNHHLLRAIAGLTADDFDCVFWNGLSGIPAFNPDEDKDGDTPPASVLAFRQLLRESDGVLICTPEYAHGVPGALKNAIDWTVSSADFSGKPTVLITASTDGKYGHAALLATLKVIEAKNIEQLQLLLPFIRTKISADGRITDEKTLTEVRVLMDEFKKII